LSGALANIDEAEISKFGSMAEIWWDRNGPFKILHDINPLRLDYIRRRAELFQRQVLDVGCGGGILSEAMAEAGAVVTGIDMAESALGAARIHMAEKSLQICYRRATVEDLASELRGNFDIITCMELVEHVPDPLSVVKACSMLAKPGGDIFFATINRTWTAYLLVILLAEHVFGIMQKGTHTYRRFIKPFEMKAWAEQSQLECRHISGYRYIPFIRYRSLTRDTRMNYLMHFRRPRPGRAS